MRPSDAARFRSKVDRSGDCWQWLGSIGAKGYAVFWLDGRQERAARIALLIDGRPLDPDRPFACHHCDNPGCVKPTHLYWGSHMDNMRDRMDRGRTARGERMPHRRVHGSAHPKAKLTEADVASIRARYQRGLGGQLMREYGIAQASLWNIVNRRTWRDVA